MMQLEYSNLSRIGKAIAESLPVVVKDPQLLKRWLLNARRAQIALAAIVLLVPLVVIPVTDLALEKLYPKTKVMGLFSKSSRYLPQRKHQAHVLIWILSVGSVVTLLLLDAPRVAAEASATCAGSAAGEATLVGDKARFNGQATLVGSNTTDLGIGPNGRYLLAAELGRGAMGIVYRAFDRVLEREVAFKELPLHLAFDAGRVDRFRQEARTLAQLCHQGIVQVFDLIEDDGRVFLAMELVAGGNLEELLREQGRLPVAEAARYGAAVAEALAYVHSRGVIHRDLKPANILVDPEGRPKITDFGIARLGESQGLTVEGSVMGSPEYMSPEQATGKPVDARSDIYSLGILLYRMMTGTSPFSGDVSAILAQQITCIPEAPGQRVGDLPQELNDLILSLLVKNPEEREQDLGRVALVLRNYAV